MVAFYSSHLYFLFVCWYLEVGTDLQHQGHLGSFNAFHDLCKVGKVQSMNSSLEKDTSTYDTYVLGSNHHLPPPIILIDNKLGKLFISSPKRGILTTQTQKSLTLTCIYSAVNNLQGNMVLSIAI